MATRKRFYLYRREYGTHRFRIGPANGVGVFVFLINLFGLIYGAHEALGLHRLIGPFWGLGLLLISLAVFAVSLAYLTDYSKPYDLE